jgi:hypothetical protein
LLSAWSLPRDDGSSASVWWPAVGVDDGVVEGGAATFGGPLLRPRVRLVDGDVTGGGVDDNNDDFGDAGCRDDD